MILSALAVGPLAANCYVVGCERTRKSAIIDPGAEAEAILDKIRSQALRPVVIINTHGHGDHIAANDIVREQTGARVMIHENDADMLTSAAKNLSCASGYMIALKPADDLLCDGSQISVGDIVLSVVHTPGHTRGGVCILTGDVVFTGDTLFAGSIGRSDLPGGSLDALFESIRRKLFVLPDKTRVYPGHGPATTIGHEKTHNPFVGETSKTRCWI